MGWAAKKADGKLGFVFINKNMDSDYKTKLKIPGLHGQAVVKTLTKETSGGLKSNDPTGEVYPSTGPKVETINVKDGTEILVPKFSVVVIDLE